MDHWDPAVSDGLARDREVILFNNAGVSSSSGEVPTSFEEMGASAIALVTALGLTKVDVLGFSICGFVAQEITLQAPDLVRRLILLGTGPRSGEGMEGGTPEGNRIFGTAYAEPDHLWLSVFFTPSQASQAAGREFLKRFRLRAKDRDPEVNERVAPAHFGVFREIKDAMYDDVVLDPFRWLEIPVQRIMTEREGQVVVRVFFSPRASCPDAYRGAVPIAKRP